MCIKAIFSNINHTHFYSPVQLSWACQISPGLLVSMSTASYGIPRDWQKIAPLLEITSGLWGCQWSWGDLSELCPNTLWEGEGEGEGGREREGGGGEINMSVPSKQWYHSISYLNLVLACSKIGFGSNSSLSTHCMHACQCMLATVVYPQSKHYYRYHGWCSITMDTDLASTSNVQCTCVPSKLVNNE